MSQAASLTGALNLAVVPDPPNATIAALFDELADLYELDGAVVHRVLAYRNAAKSVREAFAAGVDEQPRPRVLLNKALPIAEGIVEALRAHPASDRVELAGSARRGTDAVKDLDIVATASDTGALAAVLADLDVIESCSTPGDNAARARTHTGMAVDLRVVEPDQFGNVLQHLTGSKEHNMSLREAAVRRGLHVSEYGILDDATGVTARCATEEEVYERLGMAWIPPELREDRGELAAAASGTRTALIT